MTVDLRVLDPAPHGPRVLEIQRAAYRVEADLIGDDRIPALHESLEDLLAASLDWLGAFDGPLVVGAIAWTVGDALDIDRLFVAPLAARRGIGRALVRAALAAAGSRPVLVSTGRDNQSAITLYESLGFVRLTDVEVLDGLWITQLRRPPAAGCPPAG